MVAIFTGSGFGFARGSGSVLGGSGLLGSASLGRGGEGVFVNAATGNLVLQDQDEILVGKGPDDAIGRTYNSLTTLADDNNDHWRQSTDRRVYGLSGTLNTTGSTVKRVSGDGGEVTYTWDATRSAYVTTEGGGAYDTLVKSGSNWVWTDGDTQATETYDAATTKIVSASDIDGYALTFAYDGLGRLSTVTTQNGEWTRYDYSGSTQNITQIVTGYTDLATSTAKMLTRTRYGYDGSNRLTSVTVDLSPEDNSVADGKTYVTTYGYDGSGRVNSITQSDGSSLAIAYDGSGRVSTLTETPSSGVTRVTTLGYSTGYTTITDPMGQVTRLDYDGGAGTAVTSDLSAWGLVNVSRASAGTIAGAPAYQFTQTAANGWTAYATSPAPFSVNAGETITLDVTLMGVGVYTADVVGLYGYNSGWGGNGETTATVVAGPGAVGQISGGQWGVTGLSTSQATTIRLTRTFTQSEYINSWVMPDYGTGNRNGASVIVASPIFAKADVPIRLTKITAPPAYSGAAQQVVQFAYNAGGDVTSVTDANGKVTSYANFTANGLAQTVTDPLGNAVTRTFDAKNNLLSETHSGVDATGAAVSETTRYVYDAAGHLRYTISPEGRVRETVWYDGASTAVLEYTDNTYTTAGTPTEAQMNSWKSGLGTTNKIAATYYGYDARKNLTSTQTFGLADTAGGYVGSEGGTQTTYTYDQAGQLLKSQDASRSPVTYVYDGMGRLTAETDLNGGTTTWAFNDAATTTTVTLASGYVVTKTYNKAGDLIAVTDSGANTTGGTTQYTYDKLGRVRVTTDAVGGLLTYAVYDAAGRHVGDVDAAGMLTEYRYDADNRLVGTVHYHTAISSANLAALGAESTWNVPIASLRPAASSQDTASWVVYDADGRVIETIAGDGSATISTYDASGQLQQTTAYYNKIAAGTVAGYATGSAPTALVVPTADARDTVARVFYDKDGNVIGKLDGEGYLAQNTYDKAGRLITTTACAAQVAPASRAASSFNTLVSLVGTSADDRVSHFVYDARDLLRYELDEVLVGGATKLQVTAYTYNELDKVAKQAVLDTAIAPPSAYDLASVNAAVAAYLGDAGNRTTTYLYDGAERLTTEVSATGQVTTYTYDSLGHVTRTLDYASAWSGGDPATDGSFATWMWSHGTDAANRIIRTWYTARGEAAYKIDGEGFASLDAYDADGRVVSTTRWAGAIAPYDGMTFAQVAAAVASSGGASEAQSWQYDSLGRVTRATDALGNYTSYSYHGTTSLVNTATRAANGSTQEQAVTRTTYDAAGRAVQVDDAYGTSEQSTASLAYDGRGLVASSTGGITSANPAGLGTTTYTYDLDGRVKTATDAASGVTTYDYNAFGQAWRVTDPNGNVTCSWYDKLGRVIAVEDAQNYLTTTSYTVFGDIASVTRYMTALTGTPAMGTAPTGSGPAAMTSFTYDKQGRVLSSTDALNNVETYTYDALGNRTSSTNKLGAVTTYAYDRRGLLVRQGTAAATSNYPATGNYSGGVLQAASASAGAENACVYSYDGFGNLKTKVEGYAAAVGGAVTALRTTAYTYNAGDQLIQVAHDTVTTIGDDMVTVTGGVTPTESYSYDKRGNVVLATDAGGASTYSYYDDLDRKVAEIRQLAAGQWVYTAYGYDAGGNLTSTRVYDGNGSSGTPAAGGTAPAAPSGTWRETDFTYDGLGRMLTSTVVSTANNAIVSGTWNGSSFVSDYQGGAAAQGLTTTYQYDADGNVVKLIDANGNTTWSWYDHLSRKTAQLDGEGYLTAWTYDAEGNVLIETRSATKFTGTPSTGAVPSVGTSAADRITQFAYDLDGNRTSETRLNVAAWTVDPATGALTAAGSTSSVIAYGYNALGQVVTKTVAGTQIAGYSYDATGRLTSESRASFYDANGTLVTPNTSYAYDGLGDLVATTQAGSSSGAYQALSRVTTNRYGEGGRLLASTDAEGNVHQYFYDVAGRLKKDAYNRIVNADTTTSSSATTTIAEAQGKTYDLAGRVLSQSLYSTLSGSFQKVGFTSNLYNNYDQVTQQGTGSNSASGMASGTALYQVTNQYDGAGRLTGTNAGDGVWKFFGYDKAGNQTAAVTTAGYAFGSGTGFMSAYNLSFDGTYGDQVDATYTLYDHRNMASQVVEEGRQLAAGQASQALTTTRAYNAFGEVASETNALFNTVTYTYNTMGRLTRSESPAVQITDETGASYWVKPSEDYYYDLAGRRIAMRDASELSEGAYNYAKTGTSAATATSKGANTGNLTSYVLLNGTGYDGAQALISKEIHADGGFKETLFDVMGDARVVRDELYARGTDQTTANDSLHFEELTYDRLGQLVTDKHNRATDIDMSAPNDTTRLVDSYAYDQFGQRIQHWNNFYGSGDLEKTGYDALGRVTGQTDLSGYVTTTGYAWDGTLNTSLGGTNLNLGGWVETTTYSGTSRSSVSKTDLYNREIAKTDLGGHQFAMSFDVAGRLTQKTTGSTSQTFSWYNTGQLLSVTAPNGTESYTYDAVGDRLTELLVSGSETIKSAQTQYDALGRMTYWNQDATTYVNTWYTSSSVSFTTPRAYSTYHYDAVGNVREVDGHHYTITDGGAQGADDSADLWFRYDSMNRLVTDKGKLSGAAGASGTTIVRGITPTGTAPNGQDYAYDRAGQRVAAMRTESAFDYTYYLTTYSEVRDNYDYDGAGRIADLRTTSGDASVGDWNGSTFDPPASVTPAPANGGTTRSIFGYDPMSRQTSQSDYNANGYSPSAPGVNQVYSRSASYGANGRLESESTSTVKSDNKTYTSSNTYSYTDAATGEYDLGAVGSVTGNTLVSGGPTTYTRTKNTYAWWDSAQQGTINYRTYSSYSNFVADTSPSTNYTTTMAYDGLGTLTSANIVDGHKRDVWYKTDGAGQIVRRDEADYTMVGSTKIARSGNDPHEAWYRFGGKELGYAGNNGGEGGTAGLTENGSIADRTQADGTSDGTFRHAATTGSAYTDFAQSSGTVNAYAQGSAAGSYTVQRDGETLRSVAQSVYGDASLWYQIADANGLSGDMSLAEGQRLTLPTGLQRTHFNASTLKPYDANEAIGNVSPTTPKPKKNSCGVFGQIISAIVAVATSYLFGPLVGNVVSQGFNNLIGTQHGFSWGSLAMSVISAGVAKGMGAAFGTGAMLGSQLAGDVIRGAATSAITQGIGVAIGAQDKFSWAGVAAAGIGAGVGSAAASALGKSGGFFATGIGGDIAYSGASMLANAATRSAIEGSSFGDNITAALPDAIGGVLGRALGGAVAGGHSPGNVEMKSGGGDKSSPVHDKTVTTGGGAIPDSIVAVPDEPMALATSIVGNLTAQALGTGVTAVKATTGTRAQTVVARAGGSPAPVVPSPSATTDAADDFQIVVSGSPILGRQISRGAMSDYSFNMRYLPKANALDREADAFYDLTGMLLDETQPKIADAININMSASLNWVIAAKDKILGALNYPLTSPVLRNSALESGDVNFMYGAALRPLVDDKSAGIADYDYLAPITVADTLNALPPVAVEGRALSATGRIAKVEEIADVGFGAAEEAAAIPKGSANPVTKEAASRGTTLHSDKPGNLPDQLRAQYPDTEFEFTRPGVAGQDVRVTGGNHPSAYGTSSWPEGVNYGDFKPGTTGGAKTFKYDQKNKWNDPTHYLPYDPVTGKLLPH